MDRQKDLAKLVREFLPNSRIGFTEKDYLNFRIIKDEIEIFQKKVKKHLEKIVGIEIVRFREQYEDSNYIAFYAVKELKPWNVPAEIYDAVKEALEKEFS